MSPIKIILCDNGSETVLAECKPVDAKVSATSGNHAAIRAMSVQDSGHLWMFLRCVAMSYLPLPAGMWEAAKERGPFTALPKPIQTNGTGVTCIDTDATSSLARRMFDAYGAHCDWKAWDGRPMPSWEAVNDAVRSHWCAAAEEALRVI